MSVLFSLRNNIVSSADVSYKTDCGQLIKNIFSLELAWACQDGHPTSQQLTNRSPSEQIQYEFLIL